MAAQVHRFVEEGYPQLRFHTLEKFFTGSEELWAFQMAMLGELLLMQELDLMQCILQVFE